MTELESIVLGVIWKRGPTTAYAVQKEFSESLTSTWRASTGAIYPLIKRLTAAGLVESRVVHTGARPSRELQITADGKRVIRAWLADAPDWIGQATEDPIRTRMNLITLAPRRQRRTIVDAAREQTRVAIRRLEAHIGSLEHDPLEQLVNKGALSQLRARLRWLDEVERAVCS